MLILIIVGLLLAGVGVWMHLGYDNETAPQSRGGDLPEGMQRNISRAALGLIIAGIALFLPGAMMLIVSTT